MTHHEWGDKDFDWKGLDEALNLLDGYLRKYGRMTVSVKEKYGTARVSCYFHYEPMDFLCRRLRRGIFRTISLKIAGWSIYQNTIGALIRSYQIFIYNRAYQKAVRKYPHLKHELFCDIDHPEFVKGAPEVYSQYWS